MGQRNNDAFGYGLLLLEANNKNDIFDIKKPRGFSEEEVGDHVMGEDMGVFLRVKKAKVTIQPNSEKQHNEYVTEFTDFEIANVDPKLEEWLKTFEKNTGLVGQVGVFMVAFYG